MAAYSASVTPGSSARWAASTSTAQSWVWRRQTGRRLLAGGIRWRRIQLRRCRVLRFDRRTANFGSDRRRCRGPVGQGLLGGRFRRGGLRLRRCSVLRLDGRPAPRLINRRDRQQRPRAPATGWWAPTAGSSTSATPGSTVRWAAGISTCPSSESPARSPAMDIPRSPPTAGSSTSATPPSRARWAADHCTSPWWASPRLEQPDLLYRAITRRSRSVDRGAPAPMIPSS